MHESRRRRLLRFQQVFTPPGTPPADTLLIEGAHIAAVGQWKHLCRTESQVEVFDYSDRFAYPGWIDPHAHFFSLAARIHQVDLSHASNPEAVTAALRQTHRKPWIHAVGLPASFLADPHGLQQMLDTMFPHQPVAIETFDAHALWLNRAAARASFPGRDLPDVLIFRDRDMESLMERLQQVNELTLSDLQAAARRCLSYGITTVTEAALRRRQLSLLQQCAAPPLGIDLVAAYTPLTTDETLPPPLNTPHLKLHALKLFMDGALTSGGLWNSFTAAGLPSADGPPFPMDFYRQWVQKAARAGWDIWMHAIGDQAVTAAVDLLGPTGSRVRRIEHIQFIKTADIQRLAEHRIIPSVQPYHRLTDAPLLRDAAVPAHIQAYAYGCLYAAAPDLLTIGSDFPIVPPDPLRHLSAAIDPTAEPACRLPDAAAAVTAMTARAARSLGLHDRGALLPGFKADIVIYDRPREAMLNVPEARPAAVWKDGQEVVSAV